MTDPEQIKREQKALATVQAHSCMIAHDLSHAEQLHGTEFAINAASGMAEAALTALAMCCGSAQTAVWMDAVMARIILANIPSRIDTAMTIRNSDGSVAIVSDQPNGKPANPFPPRP